MIVTVQIVFLVLKLTDLVDWSWGVVLIPTWIELFMLFIFFLMGDR